MSTLCYCACNWTWQSKSKEEHANVLSSVINIYTDWFRGFGVSNEEVPRRRCCWAERTKQETSRRLILSHIQSWSYSKKVALSLSLFLWCLKLECVRLEPTSLLWIGIWSIRLRRASIFRERAFPIIALLAFRPAALKAQGFNAQPWNSKATLLLQESARQDEVDKKTLLVVINDSAASPFASFPPHKLVSFPFHTN